VLVNINPAYRAAELKYALAHVGCKALILAPRYKGSDYLAILGKVVPEFEVVRGPGEWRSQALPRLRYVIRLSGAAAAAPNTGPAEIQRSVGRAVRGETWRSSRPASRTLRCTDAVNIQFHIRHHRCAERRHAQPPQPVEQRVSSSVRR